MSETEAHDIIVGLMYQFAYRRGIANDSLSTGGLSTLEDAFDYLGWDDPHPIPMKENNDG